MRYLIAIAAAALCGVACSSIQPPSVIWEPATVHLTSRLVMSVYKANGDCEELVTLEVIVLSDVPGLEKKAYFKPWGSGVWEEGKRYEVEIGRQMPSRNEEIRPFMRHRPNKAPEPTSTSVTSRAVVSFSELKLRTDSPIQARAAPAVAVAHL